jgi:hypothetical protein
MHTILPHRRHRSLTTQRKLRAYAAQWRGVSAFLPTPPQAQLLRHLDGHIPFVFDTLFPAPPTLLHPRLHLPADAARTSNARPALPARFERARFESAPAHFECPPARF